MRKLTTIVALACVALAPAILPAARSVASAQSPRNVPSRVVIKKRYELAAPCVPVVVVCDGTAHQDEHGYDGIGYLEIVDYPELPATYKYVSIKITGDPVQTHGYAVLGILFADTKHNRGTDGPHFCDKLPATRYWEDTGSLDVGIPLYPQMCPDGKTQALASTGGTVTATFTDPIGPPAPPD